jgi:hypothetical protein
MSRELTDEERLAWYREWAATAEANRERLRLVGLYEADPDPKAIGGLQALVAKTDG